MLRLLQSCRTYSTLIGQGRGSKTRLQQVVDWVGGPDFDGCLVFDEVSHSTQALQQSYASVHLLNCFFALNEVFDMRMQCHKAKNFVPGKEAQSTKVWFQACISWKLT